MWDREENAKAEVLKEENGQLQKEYMKKNKR